MNDNVVKIGQPYQTLSTLITCKVSNYKPHEFWSGAITGSPFIPHRVLQLYLSWPLTSEPHWMTSDTGSYTLNDLNTVNNFMLLSSGQFQLIMTKILKNKKQTNTNQTQKIKQKFMNQKSCEH